MSDYQLDGSGRGNVAGAGFASAADLTGAADGVDAASAVSAIGVVGVVGTGATARDHVSAWRAAGYSTLVWSRCLDRAAAFVTRHNGDVRPATDWSDLVGSADLIDVCTPTDTHLSMVRAAAEAGRHVVCEKPIARDLAAAWQARAACRTAGVELLVGHRLRYVPEYAAIERATHDDRFGPLHELRLTRYGERPPRRSWFADPARSGGVLVDLAIHDYDYARWIAGEVDAVEAKAEHNADGLAVEARVELVHRRGIHTVVDAGWTEPGTPFSSSVAVRGTHAELRYDIADGHPTWAGGAREDWLEIEQVDPFQAQFADFVAVVERGTSPRVSVDDAIAALAIACAAERSAVERRPIRLAEMDG